MSAKQQKQQQQPSEAIESANASSEKSAKVQGQIDEVINIMQNNIEKVVARGENLENLQSKTDDLSAGALQFKKSSKQIERHMWWKDMKLTLIIGGIVSVGVIILVASLVPK